MAKQTAPAIWPDPLWRNWWWLQPDGTTVPARGPMQDFDVRKIARDTVRHRHFWRPWKVDSYEVSTVFLGLDHSYERGGPPVLFETMVFGGKWNDWADRTRTLLGARVLHAEVVRRLRRGLPPFPEAGQWVD